MHVSAIIVAAGIGSRMEWPVNKHLLLIGGRPVLAHTLSAFQTCSLINDIILVGGQERLDVYQDIVASEGFSKVRAIVCGGQTRQESCANGLAQAAPADIVCIHDGARPLVTQRVIVDAITQAVEHGAAIVAVPVKDTIKTSNGDGFVVETLPRARLWQVQTPQAFRADLLRQAQQEARGLFVGTDDAVLLERLGLPVKIVRGDYRHIKITTTADLAVTERLPTRTGDEE